MGIAMKRKCLCLTAEKFRVVGIFGSASRRRGLIITGMVMGIHAVGIVAPAAIISSSFDIHFYKQSCWGMLIKRSASLSNIPSS